MAEQSYANHRRYYPLFHYVVVPLLALHFISQVVLLIMHPSMNGVYWSVFALTLVLLAITARWQALIAQNRIIRLEERLRYKDILPADLAAKANDLDVQQIISLRFASDQELEGLVRRTLDGEFAKPDDIKKAVTHWRADHLRV
ncbi:MAG: hypothetical protein HS105_07680 [Chloracidobacterium sp.]|nr:hypothetical protein [Chloracidobacterium sp.]MCC6824377.1 hypothetical protein [Acidobacteriota bacterium]MCO5332648.1 DUF6526 family protein [Pyrinomonadaceae bacterium]